MLPKDSLSQGNEDVKYQFGGRKSVIREIQNVIQETESFAGGSDAYDIRCQARNSNRKYAKHGEAFSESLTSAELAKFTNAISIGMDAWLIISENAILVECEEKSDYRYKLLYTITNFRAIQ